VSPPQAPSEPDLRPAWRRLLLPMGKRRPEWLRWLRITARTAHILCIAGLVGTVLVGADEATFEVWLGPVIGTGLLLVGTFAFETFAWFGQLAGLVMLMKVAALAALAVVPEVRLPVLVGLVIVSSFSSHMPGRVRHWVPPGLRGGG